MGGRFRCAAAALAALMLLGCAGGGSGTLIINPPAGNPSSDKQEGIELELLRTSSGAPAGVKISWTRVNDSDVSGYYIYRDTANIPDGDPAGEESLRINGGDKILQSGSGDETLTFDDTFSPSFGDTYYYRMTVANQTDDESDFSNEETITIATHTIDGVTQAGGSIGDTVTITGAHFGAAYDSSTDAIYFTNADGDTEVAIADSDVVSWDQTEIEVKIPYGAADGIVAVSIADTVVYSDDSIDYNEPTFTNISPTEDWVQHDYITLTGTDFGPSPGNGGTQTYVYFNGAPTQTADVDESSWTTTEIKVKVPALATGMAIQVYVSVAGNDSGTQNFTLLPHIDSAIPPYGNTGTEVEISGTNFGATQGDGTVRVKGYLATVLSWSNDTINFYVPANATDGNIVVLRSDDESTSFGFDVEPTVSGLSPTRRMEGEQLTITGTGFGNARNGSTVTFLGGSAADVVVTDYVSWSSTQIVVAVPTDAKTGQVKVDINDNSVGDNKDSATSSGSVAILLPPPVIDDTGQL